MPILEHLDTNHVTNAVVNNNRNNKNRNMFFMNNNQINIPKIDKKANKNKNRNITPDQIDNEYDN